MGRVGTIMVRLIYQATSVRRRGGDPLEFWILDSGEEEVVELGGSVGNARWRHPTIELEFGSLVGAATTSNSKL
jgi:hypothetical protein